MATNTPHVKVLSSTPAVLVEFLTEAVGMSVLHTFDGPSASFEGVFGWPPNEGGKVWILGEGYHGLVEVIEIPPSLRGTVGDGLAMLGFATTDMASTLEQAKRWAPDGTAQLDSGTPGIRAAVCRLDGLAVEFLQFGSVAS